MLRYFQWYPGNKLNQTRHPKPSVFWGVIKNLYYVAKIEYAIGKLLWWGLKIQLVKYVYF